MRSGGSRRSGWCEMGERELYSAQQIYEMTGSAKANEIGNLRKGKPKVTKGKRKEFGLMKDCVDDDATSGSHWTSLIYRQS
jgi:hypothetical protein